MPCVGHVIRMTNRMWLKFCCIFSGSVFCINVSSIKSLAVTGGEDDVAYVWNVLNGDRVFTCTGQYSEHVLLFAHS